MNILNCSIKFIKDILDNKVRHPANSFNILLFEIATRQSLMALL